MNPLPTDWNALCGLLLLLGVQHGLDADHLATIDGLTRLQAAAGRRLARWCGVLFSLGHGAVVMGVALAIGRLQAWQAPAWLEGAGTLVSLAVLLVLGLMNLHAALAAAPGRPVAPLGLRSRWLMRWRGAGHPAAAVLLGALFALSFDALGLSALCALAVRALPGGGSAIDVAGLGLLFTGGMLLVDALNGLWVARLLARADASAARASRTMALAVGSISLLCALYGGGRWLHWWGEAPPWLAGAVVLAAFGLAYVVARRMQPASAAASGTPWPA